MTRKLFVHHYDEQVNGKEWSIQYGKKTSTTNHHVDFQQVANVLDDRKLAKTNMKLLSRKDTSVEKLDKFPTLAIPTTSGEMWPKSNCCLFQPNEIFICPPGEMNGHIIQHKKKTPQEWPTLIVVSVLHKQYIGVTMIMIPLFSFTNSLTSQYQVLHAILVEENIGNKIRGH